MRFSLVFSSAAMLLASCVSNESKVISANKPDILAANIDSTISPADDFFQYANGGWINKTPIPAAESGWSIGNMVQDEIYAQLKKINEDAIKGKAAKGSVTQKIGDFWKSGMDSVAIDNAGLIPLSSDLKAIDAITNTDELTDIVATLQMNGVNCMFSNYVSQDDKNSEIMANSMMQGGLGLPNREYYYNTDERTEKVRQAYKIYQLATFKQLDSAAAQKNATAVYELENKLAKSSRKLADLRDPYKNYNKMKWADLAKLAPKFNWNKFAISTGENKVDSVIVGQPEFFVTMGNELVSTSLDTWKSYLKLRLIQSSSAYLDTKTFNNYFEFRKTLTGASEPRPRWKRVLDAEENAIGEALGQLFVKEYFSEKAKKRYVEMVENVRAAYKERISKLSWMSDSTKTRAYQKLAGITKKVGYPEKWKDFTSLEVDAGPWVLNVQRANKWWHFYDVSKLGKPVDRTQWNITPQTYNAYYNPSNNEIVLPAGIFSVGGYRDDELDDAVVYGYAAASTIGHEITHGFDDQGRQYDYLGNLKNWWTKNDEQEFNKRAMLIIRQFNEFNPVDTLHVNGEATQGENIADLGGLLLGFDAFKKTDAYNKNESIAGFTQTQRYFMGYALGWLSVSKKERLANQVLTDVHAPAKERVNGPMMNVPDFYAAFGVKKGDKMFREDSLRVKIW